MFLISLIKEWRFHRIMKKIAEEDYQYMEYYKKVICDREFALEMATRRANESTKQKRKRWFLPKQQQSDDNDMLLTAAQKLRNMILKSFTFLSILLLSLIAGAQDSSGHISEKFLETLTQRSGELSKRIDHRTVKTLRRMEKHERKIYRKLLTADSVRGGYLMVESVIKYDQIRSVLDKKQVLNRYIPKLDTLVTGLKFLESHPEWLNKPETAKEKLLDASSKIGELESGFQKMELVKEFLKDRKRNIKEQLEKLGLTKELKKLNKEVYYYSERIAEYKECFKDGKKLERKALELLNKSTIFKEFMEKNGVLPNMFRIPSDPSDPRYWANLAGLQTSTQVRQLIRGYMPISSSNPSQVIPQSLQRAKMEIDKLKDRVNKLGGGSSDEEVADFKPNHQKSKSFFERIEIGTNIQSQKNNVILPITTDFGFSIGYRLNDKSIIGIGGSYRMGWGTGWKNIMISSQGAGMRSFLDWQLKTNFYISGGYEQNYRPGLRNQAIYTFNSTARANVFQQSGLIGISKTATLKNKFLKKSRVQVFWDFLSYSQIPKSQPFIFRIGYNIK